MDFADVIIVGAGVNGADTAYHLLKADVKKVIVVERRHHGDGASGKSGVHFLTRQAGSSR